MNACLLLPVLSRGQQMIITLKSLRSFCHVHLQCMTAGSSRMSQRRASPYGYRSPTSSFYQVLSPPSSIIKKCCATGIWCTLAQGMTLPVYDFILLCSLEEPSPSNTSMHPISPAIPPWTSLDHWIIFVQQQLCEVCSEFRDKSLLHNN